MAAEPRRSRIFTQLQSILDDSITQGIPGISAAVCLSGGAQQTLVAGYQDIATKNHVNESTAFGIGSITKVLVAVVVLQLIEERKLSLDDQAKTVLDPEILHGIERAGDTRIRDMLSQAGGITSWEDDPRWIKDGRGENIQPKRIWKKVDTLDYVRRSGDADVKPGEFHYANTNHTLLGLIIERITGNTAEGEIRKRILQPLDMASTYFDGFEQPLEDHTPHRYHWATDTFRRTAGLSPYHRLVRDNLMDVTGTNLSVSWTAGGMISTPTDLLKFANALRNGRLLSSESTATMMNRYPADEQKDIGHGVFRLRQPELPGTWVGHNGGVLGFTAALWWDMEGSCAVSVLANVGSSHAGEVPSNAGIVALKTDFLRLAAELNAE